MLVNSMGGKYEISGAMSGLCPFWDGQFTNSLVHALFLLVRFSLKYRIIKFNIRKEPLGCVDCPDDDCPSRIRGNSEWS